MERVDCIIIGAGVVGLAIAKECAQNGLETILLEREPSFGTITSSRNSEVVHAGIYYPSNSMKAKLCVLGNRLLYEYCQSHQVPIKAIGKLIVATNDSQLNHLQKIYQQATDNYVPKIRMIEQAEVKMLEPELRAVAAIVSASTGIVDSHALMLSYLGEFEDAGGYLVCNAPFVRARNTGYGFEVDVGGSDPSTIQARYLINSAGISAPAISSKIEGLASEKIPKAYFSKGNYFSLTTKSPFSKLIYPIPEEGSLGVHLTLDMNGRAKFGPDVEWLDINQEEQINYTVDPQRGERFYAAIRQYWPKLKDGALQPDYSGIRAKIVPQGVAAADFQFQGHQEHGIEGLINLYGIESPGLTSSLAIAKAVYELLNKGTIKGK
jgi:hypothetical protein